MLTYVSFYTSTIPTRRPISKESSLKTVCRNVYFQLYILTGTFVAPALGYTSHHHIVSPVPAIYKVISFSIYHV